jgi:hypothetical protein
MKVVSDLGEAIERRWCELEYVESKFPRIAEQALHRFEPARSVGTESVVRWLIEEFQVPEQHLDASFGQPPVMVYRGSRFYIEVLFWLDGATAIHQHGFSGAFQVLDGSSIHAQYRFTVQRPVNSSVAVGKLGRTRLELLRKGDIRQIVAGERMIHSTFHLDRPTLTLVVRTYGEHLASPQYDYWPPTIAIDDERRPPPRLDRQLKALLLLRECGHSSFATHATSFLGRTDYRAAMFFFKGHYERLRETSPSTLKRLLVVARKRYGKLVDSWPEVFAEARRQTDISRYRTYVQNPEHRYFLALLLNLSDRASILKFISLRFPRKSPKQLVLRWVRELSDPDAETYFPVTLGPASLTVFEWLLDGLSPRRIDDRLRKEAAPGDFARQRKNVRALVEKLRESWLRPLVD